MSVVRAIVRTRTREALETLPTLCDVEFVSAFSNTAIVNVPESRLVDLRAADGIECVSQEQQASFIQISGQ